MNAFNIHPLYPVEAFPVVIQYAAYELADNTRAPIALIAMELLANMSATAQGLYDVELPTGKISPVSLNCLIVAESGERMSGVHQLVAKRLYQFDAQQRSKYEKDLAGYEQSMLTWKTVEKALSRKLASAIKDDYGVNVAQHALSDWIKQKPVKPRARSLMRQNVTERAMMDALEGHGESVAFIGDEGDVIINGGVLDQLGLLNKAWDGADTLIMDRSHGVSVAAHQPRVTVAFKAQPQVLKQLLKRRGDVMRGSGHWARYLMGNPVSTQGMRQTYQLDRSWGHLDAFHERAQELLDSLAAGLDSGSVVRQVLVFSTEAKFQWLNLANQIECMLGPGGYLHDIKDSASKTMEITGRVAALLHIYSKHDGLISIDSLNRAAAIVQWHQDQFKRLFSPEFNPPLAQQDAHSLGESLFQLRNQTGSTRFPKKDILQCCPIGSSKRFDVALKTLIDRREVCISIGPKGQHLIELNPFVFPLVGSNRLHQPTHAYVTSPGVTSDAKPIGQNSAVTTSCLLDASE